MFLKEINEESFCSYLDRDTGILFTLNKGGRGVYSNGKAWYLKANYKGVEYSIATFSIKDDGHGSFKGDYKGKLWTNMSEIVDESEKMIKKMIDR